MRAAGVAVVIAGGAVMATGVAVVFRKVVMMLMRTVLGVRPRQHLVQAFQELPAADPGRQPVLVVHVDGPDAGRGVVILIGARALVLIVVLIVLAVLVVVLAATVNVSGVGDSFRACGLL